MPQIDVLFTDDAKKQLHANVIGILYDLIIDELIYPIIVQNVDEPDKVHITSLVSPIICSAACKVGSTAANGMHLTHNSLAMMMYSALSGKKDQIYLILQTGHIYFKEPVEHMDYLDWSKYMMDKFAATDSAPIASSTTTPFDMSAFSTSLATAIKESQLDPNMMVNMIANAIAKAHTDPKDITQAVTSGVSSGHSSSSLPLAHIFNVHALPPDVCKCYEDHQKGKLILGSTVH